MSRGERPTFSSSGSDDGAERVGRAAQRNTSPISDAAKVGEVLDQFRAKYSPQNVQTYYRNRMSRWRFRSLEWARQGRLEARSHGARDSSIACSDISAGPST
jgi:hypothetical protein